MKDEIPVVIELNDAEIRVVGEDGVIAVEPGYALLQGKTIRVGAEAYRAASLAPRRVFHRFWADLSQDPILPSDAGVRSNADLAHAQLSALWAPLAQRVGSVVFVVSAAFRREQLGLLLGIAKACEMPVRGLVDAAVASCTRPHPGARLEHWDVGLHTAVVSRLLQNGGVARESAETLPERGLASLRESWISCIARAFVEQERFDPLHDPGGAQALRDRLADCVDALGRGAAVRMELESCGVVHAAQIRRADLARPAEPLYRALGERVRRSEGSTAPAVVYATHRIAQLPGFADAMAEKRDVDVVRLAPDAACAGVLSRLDQLPSKADRHRLILRLGWAGCDAALPSLAPASAEPQATHAVFQGLAHRIGPGSFDVGRDAPASGAGIRVPADIPGVAGRHCWLSRDPAGGLQVESGSAEDTFVNGVAVTGRTPLRPGDIVRLGRSGVELQIIAVADAGHGA